MHNRFAENLPLYFPVTAEFGGDGAAEVRRTIRAMSKEAEHQLTPYTVEEIVHLYLEGVGD